MYWQKWISNYLPVVKRFTTNSYTYINLVLMNQKKQDLKIFSTLKEVPS